MDAGVRNSKITHVRSDTTYKFSKSVGVYKMNVPIVERISPPIGLMSGGTIVTLHGHRFQGVESVRIAGVQCEVGRVEDDGRKLRITTGEMVETNRTAGIVAADVIVKTKEGGFGVSRAKFYYCSANEFLDDAKKLAVSAKKKEQTAHEENDEKKRSKDKKTRVTDKTYVRVRANIATLMDQDGYILDTNFIPDDRFEHTGTALQQVFETNLRLHGTFPHSVSVDDVGKFAKKSVIFIAARQPANYNNCRTC